VSAFDLAGLLLVAAAGLGCANALTLRLPGAIGMVLGSLALAAAAFAADPLAGGAVLPWVRAQLAGIDLPGLFLGGVLGLLLFAATFQVTLRELHESRRVILVLATLSVVLSTAVFAAGLFLACRAAGYPLPLGWCAVIGAILAPTDAVVVDDLLRRVHLPPALRAAISGESLLNDGAGVVLFVVMLHLVGGDTHAIGHGRVAAAMLVEGLGGAALGGAAGWLALRAVRAIHEDGLVVLASLALVVAAYRAAAALEVSGPIAVVAAGFVFSRRAHVRPDPARPAAVTQFWLMLHEVLNAVLFLLIGLQAAAIEVRAVSWLPVLAAIPLAVASRLLSILVPLALLGGDWRSQLRRGCVLTWAGMRGGVSIAMVLATPDSPYRAELMAICLAVVLFTVLAQGLTLPWALRRLYGVG
jgi:monovalent cation:H+ antiporter, CPA1 family